MRKRNAWLVLGVAGLAFAAFIGMALLGAASIFMPVDAPVAIPFEVFTFDKVTGRAVAGAEVRVYWTDPLKAPVYTTGADGACAIPWSFDHNGESSLLGRRRGQFRFAEHIHVKAAGYAEADFELNTLVGPRPFADRSPLRVRLPLERP